MKRAVLFFQAVCCLAVTALAAPPRAQHVFIISFDQGAPSGIQKSEMPLFKTMAGEGAATWNAYTIVPSLTLPSHTSMLTGVGIQKHQILWNDFDPAKGLVKIPTIFSLAKEHGMVTAMFVAKEKFKTLQLPGSLDAFVVPEKPSAMRIAEAFAARVAGLKPNLCFIHFGDPDVAGHQYGMFSPEKLRAFAECDAALQVIKGAIEAAGLGASSVIILTADHGGHDYTAAEIEQKARQGITLQGGTHGSPAAEDVEIPWIAWGCGVKKHYAITAPVVIYDTAATALWLLGIDVPEWFWGRPVVTAFDNAASVKK
jgi:predicted AlkP superfamily pyrophosphatase or phosphodiesterase